MARDKRERRANPFQIGGIGLLLLIAGLALKTHVAALMEDADQQRVFARLEEAAKAPGPKDAKAVEAVQRASRYYRSRLSWELAGQLVFFVGLGLVVAAGVIWYQQAQQPESEAEAEPEAEPEPNP
jgi:hypothetical protein